MDNSRELIINELLQIYSVTKDLDDQTIMYSRSNILRTFFQRLDYLAALDVDELLVEEIVYELGPIIDAIVRFRNLYSLRLELENARSILASRAPWLVLEEFAHFSNYCRLAQIEYRGAGLKPGNTVVFIGAGPLPMSLIILCHQYGLRGVGIEREPDRAELARRVLQKLGLYGQIRILDGNHFLLPLKEKSDLVMVAAAAGPREEIFSHLAKVLPAGTRVSYRIYEKGLRRLLESSFTPVLPEPFEEYLRIRPEPPVNNTVVFLTVRK